MSFFTESEYTYVHIPLAVWRTSDEDIRQWLYTLADEDWEWDKSKFGLVSDWHGLYLRHKSDVIFFKLKFGV